MFVCFANFQECEVEWLNWLVAGSFLTILLWLYRKVILVVSDEADRIRLYYWIERGGWSTHFASGIDAVSKLLDRIFGEKIVSLKAAMQSAVFTVLYCYLAFIPGALSVQPGEEDFEFVFAMAAILSIVITYILLLSRSLHKKKYPSLKNSQRNWVTQTLRIILDASAATATGFLIFFVAVSSFYLFSSLEYGPIEFASRMAKDISEAQTRGWNLTQPQETNSVSNPSGAGRVFDAMGISLLVIPFVNFVFDFVSISITRVLLRSLSKSVYARKHFTSIAHILIDLAIAIFLMLFLSAIVVSILDSHHMLGVVQRWNTSSYYVGLHSLPFLTLLASTLVPTVLHLFLAVFSLIVLPLPLQRLAQWGLQPKEPSVIQKNVAAVWVGSSLVFAFSVLATPLALTLKLYENPAVLRAPFTWSMYFAANYNERLTPSATLANDETDELSDSGTSYDGVTGSDISHDGHSAETSNNRNSDSPQQGQDDGANENQPEVGKPKTPSE